jgi:hypothetical protein
MAITWKGMSAPASRGVFSAMTQTPKLGLQALEGFTNILDGIQADSDSGEVLKFKELINSARTPEELDGLMAQINTMRGGMGNASRTTTVDAVKNLRDSLINTQNAEEDRARLIDKEQKEGDVRALLALDPGGSGGSRANSRNKSSGGSSGQGSSGRDSILKGIESVFGKETDPDTTEWILKGFNNLKGEYKDDLRWVPDDVLTSIISQARNEGDGYIWDSDEEDVIQDLTEKWIRSNKDKITGWKREESAELTRANQVDLLRRELNYKLNPNLKIMDDRMKAEAKRLKDATGWDAEAERAAFLKQFETDKKNYHSNK